MRGAVHDRDEPSLYFVPRARFPLVVSFPYWEERVDNKMARMPKSRRSPAGCHWAMDESDTTLVIQRYLDALPQETLTGENRCELLVRELLNQAVGRLHLLCAGFLYKSYPRLTRPPTNLELDELLGGVVAGLLTALKTTRPPTVRRFFALANQHIRWQLNDLARRLDERPLASALSDVEATEAPPNSTSGFGPHGTRILAAIEGLPEEEREVFDLVGIQGLTHAEVATVVGVSAKTVQRRLNRARLLLAEQLADLRPGQEPHRSAPGGESSAREPI